MSTDLKVLSTTAMKSTLDDIVSQFEQTNGYRLQFTFAPSVRLSNPLTEGVTGDVAILTAPQLEMLVQRGRIISGSITEVARSEIGLAVPAGSPKPDISTVEGFKTALLEAKSIAMSNPVGGGQSGAHLWSVFERLGIADAVKPKVTFGPGGPAGLIGFFLKRGEAEIGLQQMPELRAVDGIDIVGPLPNEIQAVTVFAVGALTGTAHPQAATQLGQLLRSPQARAVMLSKGMEPA